MIIGNKQVNYSALSNLQSLNLTRFFISKSNQSEWFLMHMIPNACLLVYAVD